jgi:hypothetical protein
MHFDRDEGRVVLDDLRVWQGSRAQPVQIAEIEEDLAEVNGRFHRPKFFFDPWQLAGSAQKLRTKGLRVTEFVFGAANVKRLSENLLGLVKGGTLRLYPDAELERELLRLEIRETTYGWRLDHRSGGHSDRAMALAMAALAVRENLESAGTQAIAYAKGLLQELEAQHAPQPLKEQPAMVVKTGTAEPREDVRPGELKEPAERCAVPSCIRPALEGEVRIRASAAMEVEAGRSRAQVRLCEVHVEEFEARGWLREAEPVQVEECRHNYLTGDPTSPTGWRCDCGKPASPLPLAWSPTTNYEPVRPALAYTRLVASGGL